MKFKRDDILAAFDAVLPGLGKRDIVPQAQSFVFYDGKVFTYNDRIAVSIPMPEGWEIEVAVKANEMHRVLRKMDCDEVNIDLVTVEGGKELVITTSSDRLGIKIEMKMEKHHESISEPKEWIRLPEDFMAHLLRASFCASRSLAQPLLTYVHVKGTIVEALDNVRLLVQTINAEMPEFLVPREAIKTLSEYNCVVVGLSEGWIHFRNDAGVMYSTRTMATDSFPDVSKLLDVKGTEVAFPAELKAGIDKARDVLDVKNALPFIEVSAEKGILKIRADGPYANLQERYKVGFKGNLKFTVHPDLFGDALGVGVECIIGDKTMRISSQEKGFIHIVALAVLNKPTEATSEQVPPEDDSESAKPISKTNKSRKPVSKASDDTDEVPPF